MFLEQFLNKFSYFARGLVTSGSVYTVFASSPLADRGGFTALMERGDVITAHCVIQCQRQHFQISIR